MLVRIRQTGSDGEVEIIQPVALSASEFLLQRYGVELHTQFLIEQVDLPAHDAAILEEAAGILVAGQEIVYRRIGRCRVELSDGMMIQAAQQADGDVGVLIRMTVIQGCVVFDAGLEVRVSYVNQVGRDGLRIIAEL